MDDLPPKTPDVASDQARSPDATSTADKPKWPIVASIIVLAAVVTMIALGVWQLQRKGEKEALIALFERNMAMEGAVAYPELPPVEPEFLYRKSSVVCLNVVRFAPRGGSDRAGTSGIRMVAECKTGADGPGALIDIGTADDFTLPEWTGGLVAGRIVPGPEQPTMIQQMTGKAVPSRPMLVADEGLAGLRPSALPSAADTPNNHLAYALQWFFFAIAAAIIFALAVRRRLRA
jgi:surfeit locus 1 family protein